MYAYGKLPQNDVAQFILTWRNEMRMFCLLFCMYYTKEYFIFVLSFLTQLFLYVFFFSHIIGTYLCMSKSKMRTAANFFMFKCKGEHI